MKRQDLARALARKQHVSRAEAQDQIDSLFHSIRTSFRAGKPIAIPGVGGMLQNEKPRLRGDVPSTRKTPERPVRQDKGKDQ